MSTTVDELTKEIANAINLELEKDLTEAQAKLRVMDAIASKSEDEKKVLPKLVVEWYNVEVDNWEKYKVEAGEDVAPPSPKSAPKAAPTQEPPKATQTQEPQKKAAQTQEPQKKAAQTPKPKKARSFTEGTLSHAFVTVINSEPPSHRRDLVVKMIELYKKSHPDADEKKVKNNLQAYLSSSLNPKYAHEVGVLCEYGEDKVVVVKQFPFPVGA